jgi:5-amino-6-(5-phosphoribosylamino)uracil reductase
MISRDRRPKTTVILAMSADGKISDVARSTGVFGSKTDYAHVENQVAIADAVLAGAGTLRVGGTAMRVQNPEAIEQRQQQGKPPQPVQIVCSFSGDIDPKLPFFRQPVPRWLVTTETGARRWDMQPGFDRVFRTQTDANSIDLTAVLAEIYQLGIQSIAVLGGGELVAALFAEQLIDELWLTVCPLILGGTTAPTPVDGLGFPLALAPRLELLEVKPVEQEIFLHYRVST